VEIFPRNGFTGTVELSAEVDTDLGVKTGFSQSRPTVAGAPVRVTLELGTRLRGSRLGRSEVKVVGESGARSDSDREDFVIVGRDGNFSSVRACAEIS
jgi:hypothetical protein